MLARKYITLSILKKIPAIAKFSNLQTKLVILEGKKGQVLRQKKANFDNIFILGILRVQ